MPEVKLPDVSITFESFLYTLALIVLIAGVVTTVVKGWESYRKISVRDRVKNLEGRMDKVEARLQLGDKRFELQSEDMGQMLKIQQALLVHFISGNDHDLLKDQLSSLSEYMARRATRSMEIMNDDGEKEEKKNEA